MNVGEFCCRKAGFKMFSRRVFGVLWSQMMGAKSVSDSGCSVLLQWRVWER